MSIHADDLSDFDSDATQKSPDADSSGGGGGGGGSNAPISIVGREADPFQKEDWGDDFEDKPNLPPSPGVNARPLKAGAGAGSSAKPNGGGLLTVPAASTHAAAVDVGSGTSLAGDRFRGHSMAASASTNGAAAGAGSAGGTGAAGTIVAPGSTHGTSADSLRVRSHSADNKKSHTVSAIDSLFKPEKSSSRGGGELRVSKKSWDTELKFDDDAEDELQSFAGSSTAATEQQMIALASISASRRGDVKSATGSGDDASLMAAAKLGGLLSGIDLSTVPMSIPEGSKMGKLTLKQLQDEMDQASKAKAQARRNSRPNIDFASKKRDSKTADAVSLREALAKGVPAASFAGGDASGTLGPRSSSPHAMVLKKRKDSKPGLGIDATMAAQLNKQTAAAGGVGTVAVPAPNQSAKPKLSAEQLLAAAEAEAAADTEASAAKGGASIKRVESVEEPDWGDGDDAGGDDKHKPTATTAATTAQASKPAAASDDSDAPEDWDEELRKEGGGDGAATAQADSNATAAAASAGANASAITVTVVKPASAPAAGGAKRSIDDFKEKDSDDDDNWDAQPEAANDKSGNGTGSGVEPASPRTPGVGKAAHGGLSLDDSDDENERDEVPKKFRVSNLLSQQTHKPVNIIMFPSPSTLYSLTTTEGRHALSERALEQFLREIVTKYEYRFTPRTADMPLLDLPWQPAKELIIPVASTAAGVSATASNSALAAAPIASAAAAAIVGAAAAVAVAHSTPSVLSAGLDQLPATLKRVLARCYRLHRTAGGARGAALLKARTELAKISADVFSFLEKHAAQRYVSDWSQDETVFTTVHSLLYLNAKNWSRDNAKQYNWMCHIGRTCFPPFSPVLDLLETEVRAHWDGSNANAYIRIFVAMYKQFADSAVPLHVEIAGRALVDVCLYMRSLSPLTTAPLIASAEWDTEPAANPNAKPNFGSQHTSPPAHQPWAAASSAADRERDPTIDDFAWLERAFAGELPPVPAALNLLLAQAGQPLHAAAASDPNSALMKELNRRVAEYDLERIVWQLCGNPERRQHLCLAHLTRLRPNSWMRAKACFVVAHGICLDQIDEQKELKLKEQSAKLAETIMFECLFILDRVPNTPFTAADRDLVPQVPVVSELGNAALILYADVLLSLGKYTYAIAAFESALACYRYRRSGRSNHTLVRRLCDICTENDDFERSIKYHEAIKLKSSKDGNLNMYIYIVQQITKLHTARGNFRKSEENLTNALNFLRPFTHKKTLAKVSFSQRLSNAKRKKEPFEDIPASEFRGATLNVYLQLARLYLSGDRVPSAINVLENLNNTELPRGKKSVVHLLLATAYMKKRMFMRANGLMGMMENLARGGAAAPASMYSLVPGTPRGAAATGNRQRTASDRATPQAPTSASRSSTVAGPLSINVSGMTSPNSTAPATPMSARSSTDSKYESSQSHSASSQMDQLQIAANRDRATSGSTATSGSLFTPHLGVSSGDIVNTAEFTEVRAKNFLYSGNYKYALLWVDQALASCPVNSLSARARFHFRRGKIYQAMLFAQMMNAFPVDVKHVAGGGAAAAGLSGGVSPTGSPLMSPSAGSDGDAKSPPASSTGGGGSSGSGGAPLLPDPKQCITALTEAYHYFRKVDDHVGMAKSLCRIVETYLHVAMITVGVLDRDPRELTDWLRRGEFDVSNERTAFSKFLKKIQDPAAHAMDLCVGSLRVRLLLKCYLNMAEIRLLQKRMDASMAYWRECKDTLFALFMNGSQSVLVNKTTPGFTATMQDLFKRLTRLLLCYEPAFINQNLRVLDAYLLYEMDLYSEFLLSNVEEHHDELMHHLGTGAPSAAAAAAAAAGGPASPTRTAANNVFLHQLELKGSPSPNKQSTLALLNAAAGGSASGGLGGGLGSPSWKEHRAAAFGAVGSRSRHTGKSPIATHNNEGRELDDADMQARATSLAEQVCFSMYEMSRQTDEFAAGKVTLRQLYDRNHVILKRMLRMMDTLRSISGNPPESLADAAVGGAKKDGAGAVGAMPPAMMASAPPAKGAGHNRRLSNWVAAQDSSGDPLWGNLLYCLPLDNVILIYSPKSKERIARLFGPEQGILTQTNPPHITPKAEFMTQLLKDFLKRETDAPGAKLFGHGNAFSAFSGVFTGAPAANGNANGNGSPIQAKTNHLFSFENLHALKRPKVTLLSPQAAAIAGITSGPVSLDSRVPISAAGTPAPAASAAAPRQVVNRRAAQHAAAAAKEKESDAVVVASSLSSGDGGSSEADMRDCEECGCEWFTAHSWANTFCRSCFHTHPVKVTAASVAAAAAADRAALDSAARRELKTSSLGGAAASSLKAQIQAAQAAATTATANPQLATISDGSNLAALARTGTLGRLSTKSLSQYHMSGEIQLADALDLQKATEPIRSPVASPLAPTISTRSSVTGKSDAKSDALNKVTLSPVNNGGFYRRPERRYSMLSADALLPPAPDAALVREMFQCLDPQNMLTLFAALFGECRIVFSASSNFRLKAVINTLLRLMYPFQWQHMYVSGTRKCARVLLQLTARLHACMRKRTVVIRFIPLLSRDCVGLLSLDVPFIIGVNSHLLVSVELSSAIVVADLDKNVVKYRPGSFVNFPANHKQMLHKSIVRYNSAMFLLNQQKAVAAGVHTVAGSGEGKTRIGVTGGAAATRARMVSSGSSSPPAGGSSSPISPGNAALVASLERPIYTPASAAAVAATAGSAPARAASLNRLSAADTIASLNQARGVSATTTGATPSVATATASPSPLLAAVAPPALANAPVLAPLTMPAPASLSSANGRSSVPMSPGAAGYHAGNATPAANIRSISAASLAATAEADIAANGRARGASQLDLDLVDGSATVISPKHGIRSAAALNLHATATANATTFAGVGRSRAKTPVDVNQLEIQKLRSFEALRSFRDGFLDVFVNLFYKYRLFWKLTRDAKPFELALFLDHTKPECQPFIQSFVRTLSFRKFLEVRANIPLKELKHYLFDRRVLAVLKQKRSDFSEMRKLSPQSQSAAAVLGVEPTAVSVARGSGNWHTRWVTVTPTAFNVFSGKRDAKPKHTRPIAPGSCRVVIPIVEANPSYFSVQLIFDADPKNAETFHLRTEDREETRKWARLIAVNVMEQELRDRYDFF